MSKPSYNVCTSCIERFKVKASRIKVRTTRDHRCVYCQGLIAMGGNETAYIYTIPASRQFKPEEVKFIEENHQILESGNIMGNRDIMDAINTLRRYKLSGNDVVTLMNMEDIRGILEESGHKPDIMEKVNLIVGAEYE